MNDCGCESARTDLEAFARGELDCCATAASELRAHIETCDSCRGEVDVERALTVAISRACSDESAPVDLRAQVIAALHSQVREPR
ncbi:anti-sigma factor family protein [Microbacterium indicum]|uniref:anti-sigma factor family protein n=1 Tax=Microbacterium indicum TaxID=358100 RepID=UPI0003FEAE7D|nr:hypothetical protein [Microbacterium indicum]